MDKFSYFYFGKISITARTLQVKLLVHHLSDVYFDFVKSDVYSDVYIYFGLLAGGAVE